ncbi:hypothetical protein SFC43_34435 [Bacteroides sp. CR5/BHMF/2]|nr:hypothetical protein [Bacteroides sp. CR5/BHMF/2]
MIQNNMKDYKGVKDSKEEGSSKDCGAIYNWKNMYRVVQGANIMMEEITNIQGLLGEEVELYRAECCFYAVWLIFLWCVCLVMFPIIRKPILPIHCLVLISLWYLRTVW